MTPTTDWTWKDGILSHRNYCFYLPDGVTGEAIANKHNEELAASQKREAHLRSLLREALSRLGLTAFPRLAKDITDALHEQ